jgi:hypothetical protein
MPCLDGRLTWAKHIKAERKRLSLEAEQMHWLLERSALATGSKLLLYKAVLKPVCTVGDSIEILRRFQSKILRSILNAPWYTNNRRIYEDRTNAPTVNLPDNSGITCTSTYGLRR